MNTQMNLQRIPIEKLKPAKYNPRKDLKPGDPAYEKIKRSLNDYGYVDPVIWNEVTGNIVGGHQRQKILVAEGATEIDCVVVHIENPQDEKAMNIALNKAVGEWEPVALADLLSELQTSGYDLGATGFDAAEVNDLFSQVHDKDVADDDFDEDKAVEAPAFVEVGDIWLLGRHRLMCGDSTRAADVSLLMDGKKANLCITDPPYGCDYSGGTGMKIMNDTLKGKEFYEFLLSAMKNIYEHLADGGALYVFHSDAEKVNFYNAVVDAGFHYSTTCIWVKNSLVIGRMDYQMRHEPIIYAFKDTARHKFYGDRKQTTIWEFDRPTKSKLHPTTKSLPLIAYPMRNSSQENGIVVDLFGGSGSTLMAAEQLNRTACLMEIDPIYASVIVRRYVSNAGSIADVRVIRQGQTLEGAGVYLPTEEDLAFKDGTVHDTQNGPKKAEKQE
ncbi:MAG: site-specific DNA-methyltransferase [Candidatus Methanomethylophilaceae archaeon]|nr:site-specific DNA-methyltransferase [Candidatus Methanomethylophilaceae archaeon]